ncbi:thiamine-phosphate kinase [Novosphingobium huizhouense]|uniref:thiamine-phosphate kinase n=1 Tax=Novosphingobium huizhouense TaxID=2866625 RepID=UPI001CD8EA61|nr:thiamine-phosphate kinase [Novosphingobium huizhouense]
MAGEADFIAALRGLATHPAARGLADDCAVLRLGGETLVLTHDAMVEGVHWLPGQDAADVAWKLVATNLSDLAAKGAEPIGVLLGYALGADDARFLEGLREVLAAHDVPLLGGDTTGGSGRRTLGLTALGRATCDPVPSRSGAKAGHGVWLTGPVGAAMMGFEALRDGIGDVDTGAFRRPAPRLAEGRALAPLVGAMMDVSDGLLIDAARMAEASGVTLALERPAIPLGPAVPSARADDALRWGDDYELLFTLPADLPPPVSARRIGAVLARGADALLLDGAPPPGKLGYLHG